MNNMTEQKRNAKLYKKKIEILRKTIFNRQNVKKMNTKELKTYSDSLGITDMTFEEIENLGKHIRLNIGTYKKESKKKVINYEENVEIKDENEDLKFSIYSITNDSMPGFIYIGKTKQALDERLSQHKGDFKKWQDRRKGAIFCSSFELLHKGEPKIELKEDITQQLIDKAHEICNKKYWDEIYKGWGKYENLIINEDLWESDRDDGADEWGNKRFFDLKSYGSNWYNNLSKKNKKIIDREVLLLEGECQIQYKGRGLVNIRIEGHKDNDERPKNLYFDVKTKQIKKEKLKKQKEYRENNKELIAEKDAKWYEKNKERLLKKQTEYREKNKEKLTKKIKCDCGKVLKQYSFEGHKKSKFHIEFLKNK